MSRQDTSPIDAGPVTTEHALSVATITDAYQQVREKCPAAD